MLDSGIVGETAPMIQIFMEKMKHFYEKFFEVKSNEKYFNPRKKFSSYFLSFENGPRIELMHRPDISEIIEKFDSKVSKLLRHHSTTWSEIEVKIEEINLHSKKRRPNLFHCYPV